MKGIYAYYDTVKEEIVYIGKDSNIDKNVRRRTHRSPSHYDDQPINRVIQNNPNRYIYKPIHILPPHLTNEDLNGLEILYIQALNPFYNFTNGGEGVLGYKHSKEALEKLSKSKLGEKNPNYGKPMLEETKERLRQINLGRKHRLEDKIKIGNSRNVTGFLNVSLEEGKTYKKGYTYRYRYYDGGKRKSIGSVSILKLRDMVKEKGLDWIVTDEEKANETLKKELNYG